jgi:hypothetical protein
MDNWFSMLELVRSRPSGLRELIERHGATTSHEIAGALLGVLNQVRREGPVPANEANSALFGLLRTLRVWEISPWTPDGMLGTLQYAIFEDGIPEGADRGALAELIERAAAQNEETLGPHLIGLNVSTITICSSLVNWDELIPVLATKPGARESVTQHIEEMRRRFAAHDKDLFRLYSDEIEYVLNALRADSRNTDSE